MLNRADLIKHKSTYQQQLASQLVTAVMVLDEKLTIQYLNPAAEALLIKSFNKLFNVAFEDVFPNSTIDAARLQQVIESGQEFTDSDVVIYLGDSYKFTAEITASSTEFNQSPHILIELKQIDQQKQISAEAFQQQQWESARDLIRGLAHEIKNPLGGLRGAAQLLTKELNQEQQEYTAMIIEQADRLRNLVDRLLGPNQLPKMTQQNIHSVLEKVSQLISFDNEKDIILIRDYDPSIPEIAFDEDKLLQAILNIVNNAIQAIEPANSITLKTRIASNQTINGKRVKLSILISIIDFGPGIPEDIQDTLFYPMVSGRSNGTGLGLSISQTLINQHKGKLSCISRPGRTEFMILLPLSEGKSEEI
ncbi:nitrogen regulation protein NR(II) [Thalassotalea euphylliae]|uniref:histidine kinase n=1 Tax=Thalassotalea euphylliae TaxID=1655234 RepID=A0A3E0U2Z0_9GAMM|nr:nitrogen regulation protein NR(II) [Thalassotalea euphylliae]REL31090.1 nitrogen regulation protein NR(II) [Thalassotalea euphylliae]